MLAVQPLDLFVKAVQFLCDEVELKLMRWLLLLGVRFVLVFAIAVAVVVSAAAHESGVK